MTFKRGTAVRQKAPVLFEGVVTKFDVDQEHGHRQIEVSYTDEAGNVHSKFFNEDDLEEVTVAE